MKVRFGVRLKGLAGLVFPNAGVVVFEIGADQFDSMSLAVESVRSILSACKAPLEVVFERR